MRKYELIFAFILALILMFLASCKSKQVTINEQVDSISTSSIMLTDIRSQLLDFSFDSMSIEVHDTCSMVAMKSYKVKVMGGKIKSHSEQSSVIEQRDSTIVQTKYHEEKISKPHERHCWALIPIALIVIIIAFLYVKRHIG